VEEDEEDGDDMIFTAGGIHTAAKREIPDKSGCRPHGIASPVHRAFFG
jgi:hypothetical protein